MHAPRLFLVSFVLCCLPLSLGAQTFQWARSFQGSFDDFSNAIATDAAGNVYVTGRFEDVVDFDPGPGTYTLAASDANIFVSKLDAAGNFLWAANFECAVPGPLGCGTNAGEDIVVDTAGNVYVTGYFCWTIDFDPGPGTYTLASTPNMFDRFVLKLNANGSLAWAMNYGNTNSSLVESNALALDGAQNLYIAGGFKGTIDFDPGPGSYTLTSPTPTNASPFTRDAFIQKLDPAGNFIWVKRFGSGNPTETSVSDIAIDGSGNILSTGEFAYFIDFDPGPGTYTFANSIDGFLCKLDPNGDFMWVKPASGILKLDAQSNIYLVRSAGNYCDFNPGAPVYTLQTQNNSQDVCIYKLDPNGNFLWAKNFGSNDYEFVYGAAVDNASDIHVIGIFSGTMDVDPGPGSQQLVSVNAASDMYIVKLSAAGNFVGAVQMGGTWQDFGMGIDCRNNEVYSTGYFSETVDFDPTAGSYSLTSLPTTWHDIFVHKMGTIVGINQHGNDDAPAFYPNPASGRIVCSLPHHNPCTYAITDIAGHVLQTGSGFNHFTIDLESFSPGIYFVTLSTERSRSTSKIIVQ